MELLDKNISNDLDEVINYIKNTPEYINVTSIKNKMSNNEELIENINNLKRLQKLYVKSNYKDQDLMFQIDKINKYLKNTPIYVEYTRNLEEVNNKLTILKEELDNYFNNLLN